MGAVRSLAARLRASLAPHRPPIMLPNPTTHHAHPPSHHAAHVFPREAFELLLYINRAYLSSLMALLYPLQSGRLALRCAPSAEPSAVCCGRRPGCRAGEWLWLWRLQAPTSVPPPT